MDDTLRDLARSELGDLVAEGPPEVSLAPEQIVRACVLCLRAFGLVVTDGRLDVVWTVTPSGLPTQTVRFVGSVARPDNGEDVSTELPKQGE